MNSKELVAATSLLVVSFVIFKTWTKHNFVQTKKESDTIMQQNTNKIKYSSLQVNLSGVREKIKIDFDAFSKLRIISQIENQLKQSNNLIIVGIGGPSGSGKTLMSEILKQYFNKYNKTRSDWNSRAQSNIDNTKEIAFCFSGDGYHYRNDYLISNNLRQIKGFPQTFDDKAFEKDLSNIRDIANGASSMTSSNGKDIMYKLPIYDRQIHEPRQDAIEMNVLNTKIVIIESLYIIHWPNIRQMCDFVIYMDCDLAQCKKRVIRRKLQCGYTMEQILEYFERNEKVTYSLIAENKHLANVIVKSDVDRDINNNEKITTVSYHCL